MKVITNNFQILEGKNEFDFKEGINIIVGPNASGKSSLFYAIENCLINPNGVSDCINYNHNLASVTIIDNNESVTWERTADSSTYINNITNQKFVKASKLDSRDIADLGFYFDNKGRVINIHDEWSILFPFGESDSDMFRLFEDIFNISCSFQIIDEIKKDEQQLKSDINKLQQEKVGITEKIHICNSVLQKVNVNEIDTVINNVKIEEANLSTLREDYEYYKSKSSLLKDIILPKLVDINTIYEAKDNYENILNIYNEYKKQQERVNINIPKLSDSIINNIPDNTDLTIDYEQYCVNKAQLAQYMQDNLNNSNKIQEVQNKISNIKVCPTCGRML